MGDQTTNRSWRDDGLVILVLTFCLVMVGIQLLLRDESGTAGNVTTDSNGIRFESLVRGCNSDSEKISREVGLNVPEKEVSLEIDRAALIYRRTVSHACCLTVTLKHEQAQNAITIDEKWSGTPCRCLCTTQLQALFTNVPAGAYTVTAVEQTPQGQKNTLRQQQVTFGDD